MFIVRYCWESRSGDSFSGEHTAIFEDEEQASFWIEDMQKVGRLTLIGDPPPEEYDDPNERLEFFVKEGGT